MPSRALRGVLIGCGAALILAVIGVFLVVRYVSRNQDQWVARGTEIRDAGLTFGKSKRESACLAEALDRYRRDRSIMGALRIRLWVSGCLESSAVEPDFCTNVPPDTEIARSAAWRVAVCARNGMQGDSTCANVIAEVQTYCASPERANKR